MAYYIYKDSANEWRWRLKAANGLIVGASSESYHNKSDCLANIDLVKSSHNAEVHES